MIIMMIRMMVAEMMVVYEKHYLVIYIYIFTFFIIF